MKPLIINIEDITDSAEVYNSKPGSFVTWFIYIILGLLVFAFIWMGIFNIDTVVKADGIFRYDSETTDICSGVSGKIKDCNIEEGQFVKKGDELLVVDNGEISAKSDEYKEKLSDADMHIEMLEAYKKWLDGSSRALDGLKDNKYYDEFSNRKKLLKANKSISGNNTESQKKEYKKNIEDLLKSKGKYDNQVLKLEKTKRCIKNRKNIFGKEDLYYMGMVESYISNYKLAKLQYSNKIHDYRLQLKELEKSRKSLSGKSLAEENKEQARQIKSNIKVLEKEMESELANLELQQISGIEQQIETVNSSLSSLNSSLSSARLQLKLLNGDNADTKSEISVMTERNSVSSELDTYKEQRKEIKNNIKFLEEQNEKCVVEANSTGYIYMTADIKNGMYIQEGTSVCQILPGESCGYYAEIYIENQDIAKLEEGQKVKFGISAYPSSEYGYFTGKIDMISKDIKADSNTGSTYYLVKAQCDKSTVMDKNGEEGSLINGMACQAKIITGRKSVLEYVLDKIDIFN